MSDLVKCTVMLADMAEWAGRYPARSAFGATGLAYNARVEVECLGVATH